MDALKRDFEIRAQARCRSCGKARELATGELLGAAFKELERRLPCMRCRDVARKHIASSRWASRAKDLQCEVWRSRCGGNEPLTWRCIADLSGRNAEAET
jgi:hypothetical protein